MKFQFIEPDGPEYDAARMLRWEVLHKPYGMPPGSELLPEDPNSLHMVALLKKKVVGCVCFFPENATSGRVFQMAISEEYRGQGFGRKMMATLEKSLFNSGIRVIYLYARLEAEGFYRQMGYIAEGEEIVARGEKHRMMKKNLPQDQSVG